jgi:hypothetical protein
VVVVSTDHPLAEPVELVVQVKFVALRAAPKLCASAGVAMMNRTARKSDPHKDMAFFISDSSVSFQLH